MRTRSPLTRRSASPRARLARASALTLALAALAGAWPPAASAQPQPPEQPRGRQRAFRGLFGGPQDPTRAQTLTLTVSGYGGYDDNVIAGAGGAGTDPRAQVGSGIVGAGGTLMYTKAMRRFNFSANGGSETRYYPERSTLSASSYSLGAGFSYELTRRTRITASQNAAYQPFYQFGVFPGVDDPTLGGIVNSNLDLAVVKRPSWLTNTTAQLERELSRSSSLTLMYGYSRQDFTGGTTDEDGNPVSGGDLSYQMAGFRFRRALSRYMSLRLGYQYRYGTYAFPVDTATEGHNIDVGVDYARSLSFSRRTSISFSTGSSIVKTTDQARTYRVTGNASLTHEISRSWQASLVYLRDVGFFGNFNTPIFSDSVSARLRGVLADRVLVSATAGYLSGELGLSETASDFRTFTGSASLLYALTQMLGVDVTYSYFDYDFSQNAILPPGLRPRFSRNSVRAGLTLYVPLIR